MRDRHVVVVSVDAMVYEDLALFSKLYAMEQVWDKTARVNRVRSIYPTITYPCHCTMMTGMYPDKHGVVNNEQPVMCAENSYWQHMRESVKTATIFDAAKKNGMTTAAVFWPVTGNDPSIDYLIDEYWPQNGETTKQAFLDSGSSAEVVEKIIIPNIQLLENKHRQHPLADAFVMRCAADILREFKPNLLMIHPANVDAARHQSGLFSPLVDSALYDTNLWLYELFQAAKDAGIYEQTDFFIVSDHGQMEIRRSIALNALLAEYGLIHVSEAGKITEWTAFAKSGGLSALVYLKDPEDVRARIKTEEVLRILRDGGLCGISDILTEEQARKRYHLGGEFAFVVETDGWTSFSNSWTKPVVRALDNRDFRYGRATHGHQPEKGLQPTLIAFGPHIKSGTVLESANLVDEAPTFARVLGVTMENTDGQSLDELLCNIDR